MAPALIRSHARKLVRPLIALIGIHSILLGLMLMLATPFVLGIFGFEDQGSYFFPSQSGLFLILFGICYLYAIKEPAFTGIILLTKSFAVVFLLAWTYMQSLPKIIWAAAAGDAAMLAALTILLVLSRRQES